MPRISTAYVCNADQAKELPLIAAQGRDLYYPKVVKVSK